MLPVLLGLLLLPVSAHAALAPVAVGKASVYPLLDVSRDMPADIFSGAPAEEMKKLAPEGRAPSGIWGFLIVQGKEVVLVDAGYGSKSDPKSLLLESLKSAGYSPEQVTLVLLTHLHKDHVGGMVVDGKAAFPKARVLLSAPEKAFWSDDAMLAKYPDRKDNFLAARANLAQYGDKAGAFAFGDTVTPGVTALGAVGHTPGHTAFLLESEGTKMFLWGDVMHAAALQFANPNISASFDMDAAKSVSTRRAYMERAAVEKLPVAGAHLPAPGMGTVQKDAKSGNYRFIPLPR
jgi:glyoxylase-like metal-dependent hydrolase (beta-lactamase superfamily II)